MPAQSQLPGPSVTRPNPQRGMDWPALAAGALLAAAAAAAYAGTFSVPLLFDDVPSILDNPSVRHLATSFVPPDNMTVSARPVLNFTLAVNYAVGGTAVRGYHAANLAILLLGSLALFGIVRRTLARRAAPAAVSVAFSAALLWALHPLQTESVTYIIQRAESLMGLFYLLTLYCFIRGSLPDSPRRRMWYAFAITACLLGMGTKEVMVSAPLIVLLYDRTFLAGSFRKAWALRWRIHASLAATWLVLPFLVLSAHGRGGSAGFGSGVPWWSYAMAQIPAIVHYLSLCFWPHPLVFDYGTELARQSSVVVPSALVLAVLIALSAWALVRRPAIGFLGLCFFALLAPSSSFVPVATETIAEHRMFLPLIPVVLLVVMAIHRWAGRAALPICLVLAAVSLGLTWQRNGIYLSEEGIWGDTVSKRPENARAHNNLGHALSRIPGQSDEAIEQYREALRLNPNYGQAHYNLAFALATAGGPLEEVIGEYREALRVTPGLAEAHYNLGVALARVPGSPDPAIAEYEEALRLKPDYPEAHYNLGCILQAMPGRLNEAIVHYEEALLLDPNLAEAHYNIGGLLQSLPGRLDEAIAQYQEALRLRPNDAAIHIALALALLRAPGRTHDAVAHLDEALSLQPDNKIARQILARINASPH
jgi:tetratricopeptide (TPR) repeat protein